MGMTKILYHEIYILVNKCFYWMKSVVDEQKVI